MTEHKTIFYHGPKLSKEPGDKWVKSMSKTIEEYKQDMVNTREARDLARGQLLSAIQTLEKAIAAAELAAVLYDLELITVRER